MTLSFRVDGAFGIGYIGRREEISLQIYETALEGRIEGINYNALLKILRRLPLERCPRLYVIINPLISLANHHQQLDAATLTPASAPSTA